MARSRSSFFNASGCPDPTAYFGLKEVIKEEKVVEKQVSDLIHVFKVISNLAGFEIIGRVQFKHKKSGRMFK
jgi:hypothetical protein